MTASAPPLDEPTAVAIREALVAARLGRLDDACATAEAALANGGDKTALNALLGMLRMDTGDTDTAVRHLELAHAGRPADLRIATNLATALIAKGDLSRALEIATPGLAFADASMRLARLRGYAAQMLGLPEPAVEAYEHVVQGAPDDWESWNNLGNARLLAGDFKRSIADLEQALALASDSPVVRLNLARSYREGGDWRKAEQVLREMADDFADDPEPLIDLHDLLRLEGREDEILTVLDRALARDPERIELLLARARQLGKALEMQQAEAGFTEVLKRDPANGDAFVGLATVYEHSRAEALQELAHQAEQKSVEPNALNLVRAFAHRRAKRFTEGVAALALVEPDFEAPRQQHLLGQMLDGLGNYDGAFAAFTRMNELQSEDPSQPVERAASMREKLREQLRETTPLWFKGWNAQAVDPQRPSPVFLVGFPRSGTTLLDTILMGHPKATVMEERPVISRLKQELGGFDAIAQLNGAELRDAQKRYFEIASEYADLSTAAVLVDKAPLLLNEAAFIHRLFPNSPFLLAIRHPADVLLSCFVSNFNLNDSMANFLRLDTAAEFYDLTFRTWENARTILPLTVHRVTYEDLVKDPPAILRPAVEAIGLEWHEDMLDHTKTAAERGLITTASYAQVTEPIYTRSVGRWRNYRDHLDPVLPVLAPWIEKFGYTI
jgi:Flp pilus assembly protein TadD